MNEQSLSREESISNSLMVSIQSYKAEIDALTAERDKLREALQGVVRCWEVDMSLGHPVDRYFYAQAKAALQEAEYGGRKMTKEEFKARWEGDANGGGITFADITKCAVSWGISERPYCRDIDRVRYNVLVAASVADAEKYNPDTQEAEDE